jgi:hypothetical protein
MSSPFCGSEANPSLRLEYFARTLYCILYIPQNEKQIPVWRTDEYTIELHIYIEEVERKGLGRETGLQLPAEGFSYTFLFFL